MKTYDVFKGLYLDITTNWLNGIHFSLIEIYDRTEGSKASEISAVQFPNWNKFIFICTLYFFLSGRMFSMV